MKPFIIFNVNGLNGISINDEMLEFATSNNSQIDAITFVIENHRIVGIKVTFPSDTVIDKSLTDSTYQTVELILANIIGELDVVVNGFSLKAGQIHNPNLPPKDGSIIVSDMMIMCDTLSITCGYPLSRYEEIFSTLPTDTTIRDKMLVFSNITIIDNMAIRYLMQYEFLMGIVPQQNNKKYRVQKDVTDFIRDKYNPTLELNRIEFHPTRRDGKSFDEDDISYYRNILAHNDSSAIPENFETIIATFSKAATKVIFLRLNSPPKTNQHSPTFMVLCRFIIMVRWNFQEKVNGK